jgi:hypothetical protein
VGGMITSTIHVLIPVPVFFALMKERALEQGKLTLKREVESNLEGESHLFIFGPSAAQDTIHEAFL